jgi:hypothetical protein
VLPALKVGGVYTARVLALGGDGRMRIALGGEVLEARCAASVAAGATVDVEVDRLWPEVVLRIRPGSEVHAPGKKFRVP